MDTSMSNSSSLEIIDARELEEELADALRDVEANRTATRDQTPTPDFQDVLTTSQYSQVVFNDIQDVYDNDKDIIIRFEKQLGEVSETDKVGIFRTPYLDPSEFITFSWVSKLQDGTGEARFPTQHLPVQSDFYQFQYLKDGAVTGASVPWQIDIVAKPAAAVVGGAAVIETAAEATEDEVAAPRGAAVENSIAGSVTAVQMEQDAEAHCLGFQQSVGEMLKQIESDNSTLTVLSVVEQIKTLEIRDKCDLACIAEQIIKKVCVGLKEVTSEYFGVPHAKLTPGSTVSLADLCNVLCNMRVASGDTFKDILLQRVFMSDIPDVFIGELQGRGILSQDFIRERRENLELMKREEDRRKEQEEQEMFRKMEQEELEEYSRKEKEELEEYQRQEKKDLQQLKEYSRKELQDLEEYRRKEEEEQEEYRRNEQQNPEELEQYRKKEQEDMEEYRRKEQEEQEEYRQKEQEEQECLRRSGEVSWQVLPSEEQNLSVVTVLSSLGSRLETSEQRLQEKTTECSSLHSKLEEMKEKQVRLTSEVAGLTDQLAGVAEDRRQLVTRVHSLQQEKEALVEALGAKEASIVVLEDQYRSIVERLGEEGARTLENSLQRTESSLEETNRKLTEVERTSINTQELLLRTAEDLNTSERRRLRAEAELAEAKRRLEEGVLEKGQLVDKLMKEITKRESLLDCRDQLLQDSQHLCQQLQELRTSRDGLQASKDAVERELKEANLMLEAAQRSKETAGNEIITLERSIRQLNEQLQASRQLNEQLQQAAKAPRLERSMQPMAVTEEATMVTSAPVTITSQEKVEKELVEEKKNKEIEGKEVEGERRTDSDIVKVLVGLGSQLEAAKLRIQELEGQQLRSSEDTIYIHEAALRDADTSVQRLSVENMRLREELTGAEHSLAQLQEENIELKLHLDQERSTRQKIGRQMFDLNARKDAEIKDLTNQIEELKQQIDALSLASLPSATGNSYQTKDPEYTEYSEFISHRDVDVLSVVSMASSNSENSNLNSLRIEEELTGARPRHPAVTGPQGRDQRTKDEPSGEPTRSTVPELTRPLVPEKVDPVAGIPELRPKSPARYSMSSTSSVGSSSSSSSSSDAPKLTCFLCNTTYREDKVHECLGIQGQGIKFECPICNVQFQGGDELIRHVEQHVYLECPVCNKPFDQGKERDLEAHVNTHFREDDGGLNWSLGID